MKQWLSSSTGSVCQWVTTEHLKRNAYLYIRQSSLQQVFHNTESTQRQYALKQRAIALGWPAEQVVVIDTDQGISGASAADREGFQKLVTEVILHPDRQVRQSFETFFALYERLGSAMGVVRYFAQHHLLFPRRVRGGPHRGELVWGPLIHTNALQILRNPRYAGAFVFGRTRACRRAHGQPGYRPLPQDQWHTFLPDAHPGYISWEQYQEHLRTLHASAQARGLDRRLSPPGEGPALLQGLVVCGVCGRRMTLRYHTRRSTRRIWPAVASCRSIPRTVWWPTPWRRTGTASCVS